MVVLGDFAMRHGLFVRGLVAIVLAAAVVLPVGCRTSVHSGLPKHIKTVEVEIFQNKTMYKSIEAWITRDIIDAINADPSIRVVSNNGDAVIYGEIHDVRRQTLRDTTNSQPNTVKIVLDVSYSFYDNVNREYIIDSKKLTSTETGYSHGISEYGRGEVSENGERSAAKAVAAEIVRQTVGMW